MDSNTVKTFLEEVGDLETNALVVTKKMLEGGKEEVTLNLTKKKIMPERMESPPRNHICHEATTFAQLIEKNISADTIVLIDVENEVVSAVLNDKAEKGFEVILLKPAMDPRFKILEQTILNKSLSPKQFATAALLNRELMRAQPHLPMLLKQITIANNVVAHEGMGNNSVNGLTCETQVKAGRGSEEIVLPDEIEIETPIYIGTPIQNFKIQVTVLPQSATEVKIQVTSPDAELKKFQVFQDMLADIKALKDVLVGYGKPWYDNWKYNR